MSANIAVQGSAANGQQVQDQPLANGVVDVGGNIRLQLGDTNGATVVTGLEASGSPLTGDPIPIAGIAGSNVQQIGANVAKQLFVSTEGQKKTYSYGAKVTPDTAATDIATLLWQSGVVRLLKVGVSLNATAAGVKNVYLLKRSTANSGGSSTTPTPVPHDSADGAAASIVTVYTANPTLGTSLGALRAAKIGITAADGANYIEWDFTKNNDKAPVLRSANQAFAINFGGDALLTSELDAFYFEWSEEA